MNKYIVKIYGDRWIVYADSYEALISNISIDSGQPDLAIIWHTRRCALVSDNLYDRGNILSGKKIIGIVRRTTKGVK